MSFVFTIIQLLITQLNKQLTSNMIQQRGNVKLTVRSTANVTGACALVSLVTGVWGADRA